MKDDCEYIYNFAEKVFLSIPRGRLQELAREAITVMAKVALAAEKRNQFCKDYADEIKIWGLKP